MRKVTAVLAAAALLAGGCRSAPRWTAVEGTLHPDGSRLRLEPASPTWALALLDAPPQDATIEAEIDWRPAAPSAQAGLVFGYRDEKTFGLCVLSQSPLRPGEPAAEAVRTIAFYQVADGRAERVNVAPWLDAAEGPHRLEVVQAGPQALARLDGRPVLQWAFPPLGPGRAGLAVRGGAATFGSPGLRPTPAGTRLPGPFAVPRDASGAVRPRWTFHDMIERTTEFAFAVADRAAGNAITDEDGKRWPCYIYHATVSLDGTLNFPTNYPPEQFTPYLNGFLDHHQFTGDPRGLDRAVEVARWIMAPAHNTPADWPYGNLAYTTVEKGKMGGQAEGELISIEEQGYVASAILRLYHLTGDRAYLDYAARIGDTLRRRQLPEGHWPYRVHPRTGEPNPDFTANVVDNILFFDEMRRTTGDAGWSDASERAWRWLREVPLPKNRWLAIFGDVRMNIATDGREENYAPWVAQWAARCLLRRRGESPDYVPQAEAIRRWIAERFIVRDANGELGVTEQARHFHVMPGHGFRQAMLEADLYEATGKDEYRRMALHLMDASMYFTEWNGLVRTYLFPLEGGAVEPGKRGGWSRNAATSTWWSNQMWAPTAYLYVMAALPERAPANENHLLRTSAPLTFVRYSAGRVEYGTARDSTDRLTVAARPRSVRAGGREVPEVRTAGAEPGWTHDPARHVLDLRHPAGEVAIELSP